MSRITAAGPPPKRPPHNELEPPLRVVIGTLLSVGAGLLGLAACGPAAPGDKGKADASQAGAPGDTSQADGPRAGAPAGAGPKLSAIDRSHAGEAAPAVAFEAAGGKQTRLGDFAGKPVLVNLWATWCAPCLAEMPDLDALAKANAGRLTVLPISQDLEGWPAVTKFFASRGFAALKPYLDQPGNYAQKLDAKGLPLSILYDAAGKERWRVNGPLKWTSAEVAAALG